VAATIRYYDRARVVVGNQRRSARRAQCHVSRFGWTSLGRYPPLHRLSFDALDRPDRHATPFILLRLDQTLHRPLWAIQNVGSNICWLVIDTAMSTVAGLFSFDALPPSLAWR
jgi:hypothetical protein